MESAITVWVDESTDIIIGEKNYTLVGYLITNSDKEEFEFLNKLKQARKQNSKCWTTMHGNEISETDIRKLELLDIWLNIFIKSDKVYFHAFLYERNSKFISKDKTYEHYFAKQSLFALANKMKKTGHVINTMFSNTKTLTVIFDRRRSHCADIISKGKSKQIDRLNELEDIYKDEISKQILKISGKDSKTTDITVRFSFVSSECFDGMQFSDCLLYLIRQKIISEESNYTNKFTELFDKHFLNNLNPETKRIGFKKIYEYDKKFNFFESTH